MDNKEIIYRKLKHISIALCLISLVVYLISAIGAGHGYFSISVSFIDFLEETFYFFAHVMWGALCQHKAYSKCRNANLWGILGFAFGIFPLVVLFFLPKAKRNRNEENNIPNMPF